MTLIQMIEQLKLIDPKISKNRGNGEENHTTWRLGANSETLMSDDQAEDAVKRVYIDRFTKIDSDPIVQQIAEMLDANFIPFELVPDDDPENNDHHYSFTCYVE